MASGAPAKQHQMKWVFWVLRKPRFFLKSSHHSASQTREANETVLMEAVGRALRHGRRWSWTLSCRWIVLLGPGANVSARGGPASHAPLAPATAGLWALRAWLPWQGASWKSAFQSPLSHKAASLETREKERVGLNATLGLMVGCCSYF